MKRNIAGNGARWTRYNKNGKSKEGSACVN
jgi:hypothetical protein